MKDYYEDDCVLKICHYLYKDTLYYMNFRKYFTKVPDKKNGVKLVPGMLKWKSKKIRIDNENRVLPFNAKSIICPNGDLYLMGGNSGK